MEESAEDGENSENRARLQSQISSLRDEMTSLHDILEGYTKYLLVYTHEAKNKYSSIGVRT